MAPGKPRTKVLSIVGAGRSGTTLLASILGEVDGFGSAGELRWLWQRGVLEERPCGCGQVPSQCPVWAPVIASTLSAAPTDAPAWTARQIVASQHELTRQRNLPRLLRSAGRVDADWALLDRVRTAMGTAVAAFADVTGTRVVVDTSKRPQDAAVLSGLADVDHYVLHVVRDPRAVVHSWRRAKTFAAGGGTRTMGTRRLPSTVRRWTSNNLSTELLSRRLPDARWLRMRYEDFAASPRTGVEQILALLGEEGAAPFQDERTVLLRPNHIVAGNPSRFTTGAVAIRTDDEWRQQMPRRDQLLVEATTAPLMLRYGYLGVRPGPAPAPRK